MEGSGGIAVDRFIGRENTVADGTRLKFVPALPDLAPLDGVVLAQYSIFS